MKKLILILSVFLMAFVPPNKSDNNGIAIVDGNGQQDVTIFIENGESMQLTCIPLIDPEIGKIEWYTNDQQICYVNWVGVITGTWIGTWLPNYPNTTVITAVQYRRNPKYNGHNNEWLAPYQDRVFVTVLP